MNGLCSTATVSALLSYWTARKSTMNSTGALTKNSWDPALALRMFCLGLATGTPNPPTHNGDK
jgi:hypothetical protein